jgi:hypothetical protein
MTDQIVLSLANKAVQEAKKYSLGVRKIAWERMSGLDWGEDAPIGKEYIYHDYLAECIRIEKILKEEGISMYSWEG